MCTLVALDSVDCRSKWNSFRQTFLRISESGAFAISFLLRHRLTHGTEHPPGPYCITGFQGISSRQFSGDWYWTSEVKLEKF